jgi:hypothetical protein
MNGLWLVPYGGLRSKCKVFFVRSSNVMSPEFCHALGALICVCPLSRGGAVC